MVFGISTDYASVSSEERHGYISQNNYPFVAFPKSEFQCEQNLTKPVLCYK